MKEEGLPCWREQEKGFHWATLGNGSPLYKSNLPQDYFLSHHQIFLTSALLDTLTLKQTQSGSLLPLGPLHSPGSPMWPLD